MDAEEDADADVDVDAVDAEEEDVNVVPFKLSRTSLLRRFKEKPDKSNKFQKLLLQLRPLRLQKLSRKRNQKRLRRLPSGQTQYTSLSPRHGLINFSFLFFIYYLINY